MRSRDQVLDELDHLATVAHALCVEYLFICCALGDNAESVAAAAPPGVSEAVDQAQSMAEREMFQLRPINAVLTACGWPSTMRRATEVRREGAPPLALAPLTAAQLDGLLDRELAIASAVDHRYALLAPSVAPGTTVFDEDLRSKIEGIVTAGSEHEAMFTALRDFLHELTPSQYLLATHDAPADGLQRSLRDISDRCYELIVVALAGAFAHEELGSAMVQVAVGVMRPALQDANRRLAGLGVLPAFTLPASV